ncbi:unnamed protein product [Strongylus vulgaris]|uniref:Uncharacterized protein n=1 Tax=Strongylus vulgaris TaxID=40348 RepID=A0A3P7IZ33_STRVU|nr:unnamed protein product [Strongylus vulgaris]
MLVSNCGGNAREVQIHYSLPAENSAGLSVQRTQGIPLDGEGETLILYLNCGLRRELSASVVLQQKTSFQRSVGCSESLGVARCQAMSLLRSRAQGEQLNQTGGLGALEPSDGLWLPSGDEGAPSAPCLLFNSSTDRSPCSSNARDLLEKTSPRSESLLIPCPDPRKKRSS